MVLVVGVERLGDEDLVAVVEDALEDDGQGLAAAGGDQDLVLLEGHIQLGIVILDGVDELRHTGGGRVLQDGELEIADGLEILRGRLDIGLADVQVIDLAALFLGGHREGVELPHGGEPALHCFAGKLHVLTSNLCICRQSNRSGSYIRSLLYVPRNRMSIPQRKISGEVEKNEKFSFRIGKKCDTILCNQM